MPKKNVRFAANTDFETTHLKKVKKTIEKMQEHPFARDGSVWELKTKLAEYNALAKAANLEGRVIKIVNDAMRAIILAKQTHLRPAMVHDEN